MKKDTNISKKDRDFKAFLMMQNDAGYFKKLVDAGYVKELVDAGYFNELVDAGYFKKLVDAGYVNELVDAGYFKKLVDAGYVKKLVDAGYFKKLVDAGYVKKLVDVGYVNELVDAGYFKKLVDVGYVKKLVDAGYFKKLVDAGYVNELVDAVPEWERIPIFTDLYSSLLSDIKEKKRVLQQSTFGEINDFDPALNVCGSPMCIGGHIVNKAGKIGYDIMKRLGWFGAATIIHLKSHKDIPPPDFNKPNQELALAYIEYVAELETETSTK